MSGSALDPMEFNFKMGSVRKSDGDCELLVIKWDRSALEPSKMCIEIYV